MREQPPATTNTRGMPGEHIFKRSLRLKTNKLTYYYIYVFRIFHSIDILFSGTKTPCYRSFLNTAVHIPSFLMLRPTLQTNVLLVRQCLRIDIIIRAGGGVSARHGRHCCFDRIWALFPGPIAISISSAGTYVRFYFTIREHYHINVL